MTHLQKAIEDAVKGGWTPKDIPLITGSPLEKNGLGNYIHSNNFLIDPDFWRALGEERGWERTYDQELNVNGLETKLVVTKKDAPLWQYYWHLLIDHLAEGKDVESFFSELK